MRLKEYLDMNGIKYKYFAKKLGISSATIFSIMKNNRDLRLETAWKIVIETSGQVSYEDLLKKKKKSKNDSLTTLLPLNFGDIKDKI